MAFCIVIPFRLQPRWSRQPRLHSCGAQPRFYGQTETKHGPVFLYFWSIRRDRGVFVSIDTFDRTQFAGSDCNGIVDAFSLCSREGPGNHACIPAGRILKLCGRVDRGGPVILYFWSIRHMGKGTPRRYQSLKGGFERYPSLVFELCQKVKRLALSLWVGDDEGSGGHQPKCPFGNSY